MIEYDAQVIQKFAADLYRRASTIILKWSLIGLLVGIFIGGIFISHIAAQFGIYMRSGDMLGVIAGGAIGLLIGYNIGSNKAFWLKLQAQTALCQVQIEKNTARIPQSGGSGEGNKESQ